MYFVNKSIKLLSVASVSIVTRLLGGSLTGRGATPMEGQIFVSFPTLPNSPSLLPTDYFRPISPM